MLKLIGIGASIIAFVAGYGAMKSDVKHQGEEIAATRVQVDRIYDRLLWNERQDRGEAGPVPPASR